MPKVESLRDLLPGDPHPAEREHTAQRVVERWRQNLVTERTVVPDPLSTWTAKMPGDDVEGHPLHGRATNPFPGINVLELARMLQAGQVPMHLERQVIAYIDQYERLDGQSVFGGPRRVPGSQGPPAASQEPPGPIPNWPGHHR